MATRTGLPGTWTSSSFATYTDFNNLPGGCIARASVSSNQGSITSVTDLTSLTLTITPGTSRLLRIAYTVVVEASTTGVAEFQINVVKDGSTMTNFRHVFTNGLGSTDPITFSGWTFDSAPTVASHTYKLTMGRVGSDGNTWTLHGSSTGPSRIAIFDDGPDF